MSYESFEIKTKCIVGDLTSSLFFQKGVINMTKWKGKKVKKAHMDSLKRAKEFRDFYWKYNRKG